MHVEVMHILYHKATSDIFSRFGQITSAYWINHVELKSSETWHRNPFHDPLTPVPRPSAVKQPGSHSLWVASNLAAPPSCVLQQLHEQLRAAKWKCSGSISIFSPDGFVFITHTAGAPPKSVHGAFSVCGERCAWGAFGLDKLITELYIFFLS